MGSYWDGSRWGEDEWAQSFLTRLGIDGLGIELFSYGPGVAAWGQVAWGGGAWTTRSWHAIACDVTQAQYSWGADRSLGVLTVAAGGSVQLNTYDPDGTLDPTNASSPYAYDLFPGSYMRLTYQGVPIAIGILDSVNYSNASSEGSLDGTDAVGVLSNVQVVVPQNPPTTLRALARSLVALAGLRYVSVEPDPPSGDPAVGALETASDGSVGLWSAISAAAIDALHYAWVGPDLLIHFRSHGDPIDYGLTLGLDGIPLLEVIGQSTADGIVNDVLARGTTGTIYHVSNPDSIARFGRKTIDRSTRRVPDPVAWADRVLADRAWASLEYLPSQIIPATAEQLIDLVNMGGMSSVRIRTDLTDPPISVDVRSIGLQVEVSPDGWSAAVLGYVSNVEWIGNMTPPPPEPPTTTVPALVGLQLTDAMTQAAAAQLVVVSSETESTAAPGQVLTQSPAAGTVVAPYSTVTLTVAKAAVPVTSTVPSIAGQTEAAALSALSAAQLVAGTRTEAHAVAAAGTVTAQSPAAGTQVAIGSAVAYTVSLGPVRVTRTTTSTKGARVALTNTGAKYGTGAELYSPVGAYQGWENRSLIGLAADFAGAVSVVKAVLRLRTSTQDNVAFGSNPKLRVQRLTANWSEGSSSTPSSGNAVVWPGPAATSTGEVTASITRSESTTVDIDVTALVRAWAPAAAGGSGAVNYGLRLIGYSETNDDYTTEFATDDNGTAAARPQLILTLDTI